MFSEGLCQESVRKVSSSFFESPQVTGVSNSSRMFGTQRPGKREPEPYSPVAWTVPGVSDSFASTPCPRRVRAQPSSCPDSPHFPLPPTYSQPSQTLSPSGQTRDASARSTRSSGERHVHRGISQRADQHKEGGKCVPSVAGPGMWPLPPSESLPAAKAPGTGERARVPESSSNTNALGRQARSERGESTPGLQSFSESSQTERPPHFSPKSAAHLQGNSLSPVGDFEPEGCSLAAIRSDDHVEESIPTSMTTRNCPVRQRAASSILRGATGVTSAGCTAACGVVATPGSGAAAANAEGSGSRKGKLRRKRKVPKVAWRSTQFLRQLEDERNEEKAEVSPDRRILGTEEDLVQAGFLLADHSSEVFCLRAFTI